MSKRYEPLEGYEISGCAAFDKNLVSIWGQQWPHGDPLEPRPTSTFFYYADEPEEDQWAYSGIANATGIHGCAGLIPQRQWVYLLDDGEVYVVGGGADDFEQKITPGKMAFFSNVRAIRSGDVLAVGSKRKVFLRERANGWRAWGQGLLPQGAQTDLKNAGFSDIDGFDLGELYACGGSGDLWLCRQSQWEHVDLGTNAALTHICCASDGFVYVVTQRRGIYKGRHHRWQLIQQEPSSLLFESIVDFQGRVLVSTEKDLFEIVNDQLVPAVFPGMPEMRCKAHLAVGEGVLLVAGKDEALMFDGKTWTQILSPQP